MWGTTLNSMPSEEVIHNGWHGTGWDYTFRNSYSYNGLNQVTEVDYELFTSNWEPVNRRVFTYDINNNVDQITWQSWDPVFSEWDLPLERHTYTWELTTVNDDNVIYPASFNLSAYPNPFKNNVNIRIESKSITPIETAVYNLKGQLVKFFDNNSKSLIWDGEDDNGRPVSNGIYFIRATQDGKAVSRKVIRIR